MHINNISLKSIYQYLELNVASYTGVTFIADHTILLALYNR